MSPCRSSIASYAQYKYTCTCCPLVNQTVEINRKKQWERHTPVAINSACSPGVMCLGFLASVIDLSSRQPVYVRVVLEYKLARFTCTGAERSTCQPACLGGSLTRTASRLRVPWEALDRITAGHCRRLTAACHRRRKYLMSGLCQQILHNITNSATICSSALFTGSSISQFDVWQQTLLHHSKLQCLFLLTPSNGMKEKQGGSGLTKKIGLTYKTTTSLKLNSYIFYWHRTPKEK